MKIGFIGAGNVTRTFGRHLINAGHTIVVGSIQAADQALHVIGAFLNDLLEAAH
jgi:3-hydroxyisobutyrate dehydrogenase-like beta-hydroxyacid dehydrogenase